jgi:hypothetical protein
MVAFQISADSELDYAIAKLTDTIERMVQARGFLTNEVNPSFDDFSFVAGDNIEGHLRYIIVNSS